MRHHPDNLGAGSPLWDLESNIDVEHSENGQRLLWKQRGLYKASESGQKDVLEGKPLC